MMLFLSFKKKKKKAVQDHLQSHSIYPHRESRFKMIDKYGNKFSAKCMAS